MANPKPNDAPAVEASASVETAPEISLSLTDFCIRLSESVRRPEMIGAFEAVERRAGRVKASESEFRSRYDAFVNKPV